MRIRGIVDNSSGFQCVRATITVYGQRYARPSSS